MIKIEKDRKGILPDVWITSDTHYNHANICRGTTVLPENINEASCSCAACISPRISV